MKRILKLIVWVMLMGLPVVMTSCDGLVTAISDNPISPGLKVTTPSIQVEKGKTFKCNAKASSRTNLVYASADPSIATVDSYGIITGVKEGKTTITVTTEGKDSQAKSIFTIESVTIPVEVIKLEVPVKSVKLDKTELAATLGDDPVKFVATVNPDNADSKTVVWTTSDETVATVEDGVVTFVGGGTATITATATNGTTDAADDKTAECEVTVNKKAGSMSYPKTSETVGVSKDDFVNPITIEGDGTVTYSSSDTSIAEVDSKTGVITPHKAGTVTIKATITDGKTTTYETKEIKYTLKVNYPYMKWDETTKTLVEADPLDETTAEIMPAESELADGSASTKLLPAGTYIIAEDMTFDNYIRLQGDVDIILCDGATLTINKELQCGTSASDRHGVNIYGQSENTGKLIVISDIYNASPLNVYGGQIDITTTDYALRQINGMNVYGGKVNAVNNNSSSGGAGIQMRTGSTLTISGGEVTAIGPATDGSNGSNSYGISGNGNVVVNGGKLVAIGKKHSSNYSNGIYGNLTVNGGSVEVKDVYYESGEVDASCRAAVSGTITLGTGVSMEGKKWNTDWTDITDNSNGYQHIRTNP